MLGVVMIDLVIQLLRQTIVEDGCQLRGTIANLPLAMAKNDQWIFLCGGGIISQRQVLIKTIAGGRRRNGTGG